MMKYKRLVFVLFFIDCLNLVIMGQSIDESIERARSLSSMADFYISSHNYEKAIELEKQSLEMRQKLFGSHDMKYDVSVSNLAWYYYLSGDYNNAVKFGEENVKLWTELVGKDHEEYPGHLADLAEYHRKNGSYQKAIEYQIEVADLYSKSYGEDIEHYAASLIKLSQTYSEIGDFPKAVSTTEKVIDIYRKNNIKDENLLFSLSTLAYMYIGVGNHTKAEEIGKEISNISETLYGKKNYNYAKTLSDLGLTFVNVDNEKALEHTKIALSIYENSKEKDNEIYGGLLENVSFCCSAIGDFASAIRYSSERLKLLDDFDISYSRCLESIAKYYANMKDYSKATEYIYNSLNSIKKMIDRSNNAQDSYRQNLYWVATGYFDDLVGYVTNNITPSTVSMLYDEALNTKTIRLRKGNQGWYSWKDVRSHLKNNEIAIEFIHNASVEDSTINIYALLLKKDFDYPKMIKVSDDNEFIRCMERANSSFERDYNLGKVIWGRLEDELRGVNDIFFTPTWTLTAMPIEHFPVSKDQNYNDLFNICRMTSTMQLIERDEYDNSYSNAVLYGGLTYEKELNGQTSNSRSGFEPLFNTQIEIDEISDVLNNVGVKTAKFTGVNGTERSVRNLSGRNTDILHIATHGINTKSSYNGLSEGEIPSLVQQYDPNDDVHSNSLLVMSGANPMSGNVVPNGEDDGLLTSKEVSQLDLHKIKLLVLSACESGRGNYGTDDMLWGIQRGFKEAGVKSILMSLKKVDDEATRILMVDFYKNLMKGKTKLQSLKDAQKHLRQIENGKYNDPIYWASFIMLDGLN